MRERNLLILASLLLALAVVTGAFGAHGLRNLVSPAQLATWQTAVLYHWFHGLGLLGIVALAPQFGGLAGKRLLRGAAWCFVLGIALFSGSLYALALTGTALLGAITPAGGVAFILGWLLVALAAARRQGNP